MQTPIVAAAGPLRPSDAVPLERKLADRAEGLASAAQGMRQDVRNVVGRMTFPEKKKAAEQFREAASEASIAADIVEGNLSS